MIIDMSACFFFLSHTSQNSLYDESIHFKMSHEILDDGVLF